MTGMDKPSGVPSQTSCHKHKHNENTESSWSHTKLDSLMTLLWEELNYSLLKKNDPFFSEDLLIIQLGVVNKILKDLKHKNATGKAHRILFPFSKDGIFCICTDFMSWLHVQLYIDIFSWNTIGLKILI